MYYADELEQYEEYLEKSGFLCEERNAEDGAVVTSYYTFLEALWILLELKTRGFLNKDSYNKILNALLLDTGVGLGFTLFP